MTTFDDVMAEAVLVSANSEKDRLRAVVAVLGKRSLALVLRHELVDTSGGEYAAQCPECGSPESHDSPKSVSHNAGCEWGVICDEVRKYKGPTKE